MDLLTALMHEMGHVLGLDHDSANPHDVMADALAVGERRLPSADDTVGVVDATHQLDQIYAAADPVILGRGSPMPDIDINALYATAGLGSGVF